jgi:hypothetical protein
MGNSSRYAASSLISPSKRARRPCLFEIAG